jgi:ribose transport system substrate-binding protein
MKRTRVVLVLTLGVLLAVLFTAPAAAKQFKIGINNFGQANFFARIGREAMLQEVKKLGGVPVATVTDNVPARTAAIENFIAQGVDAILIQEGDIKMVAPVLKEAKKKGILIASVDAGFTEDVDVIVESNNWILGVMAATNLLSASDGEARVVEIYNDLGQMIRMRRKMLQTMLTEYPSSKIVAGFTYAWPDFFPDVKAKMEAVLQANLKKGSINAVFATFDGAGVAAAQAIREAGRTKEIKVVGIDGDPNAYEEMKKADSPYIGTVAQDPDTIARTAVQKIFAMLKGNKKAAGHYYIPGIWVSRDEILANPNKYK